MSDQAIVDLLRQAPFSFVGTVEHLGAATMSGIPIDERTAVVHIDHVLHAPEAFAGLGGQRITMKLRDDQDLPAVGSSSAFFAEGMAFGESLAVTEVGRLPVDAVEPHITQSLIAGQPNAFAGLQNQVEIQRLREHAGKADAVVIGRVSRLASAGWSTFSEHDPDWWIATITIEHVDKGDVPPGEVAVAYANSLDVRWRSAPKPRASQGGMWILHATEGTLRQFAPYQILDPDDYQPTQKLEAIRGGGG